MGVHSVNASVMKSGLPTTGEARPEKVDGRRLFMLAVLLLLATRLCLVLSLEVRQWSDLEWYFARAVELLETGRYAERGVSTAFWPVGYPAFLAGVLWLTSPSALAGQLANVALSLTCMVLLHRWCLRHFDDQRVAGAAALLFALYPNQMGYSAGLYSEPLFTALLLALVLLMQPRTSLWRIAAAGFVAGLATLVKAQTMLLAPLLLFVLSLPQLSASGLRSALRQGALGTLVMAATIAPWTYRNWLVLGSPVPVSTNGGMSLLAGNNPAMTTGLGEDFNDRHPIVAAVQFSVADQVDADRRARAAAWGWVRDNPGQFVALMPKKLFRLWALDGESEWLYQAGFASYEKHRLAFRSMRVLNQAYYVALLVGFLFAWRVWFAPRNPAAWPVPIMITFFSALSMIFSGQSRYHSPLMPFIIGYAAWAIFNWHRKGRLA